MDDGRVVKGIKFKELRDAGDPVEVAQAYEQQGADELVFLDITASSDERATIARRGRTNGGHRFMPVTVGGGIRTLRGHSFHASSRSGQGQYEHCGILNPSINDGASTFGNQCIVVAIDAKRRTDETGWLVYTHGGRKPTELDAVQWAREVVERGAGEILLTSMDCDGTKGGYDLELTRAVSDAVEVPVIASGGVGDPKHMADGILKGKASAVLVASIFHFGEYTIPETKRVMQEAGIPVRL